MRILVLGAGGIGGYYGGRAAAGGADVTFLVRPRRAAQIAAGGLVIKSPLGDATVAAKTVLAEDIKPGWDAIILACKAYDLDSAIAAIRPAAAGARIIPQLNGMQHLERLDAAFGAEAVLGGTSGIAVTLDDDGTVRHLNAMATFGYGPRMATQAAFCDALQPHLAKGGFDLTNSPEIVQMMWEKWVFLCSIAGMNCLFRANVGSIVSATPDAAALMLQMVDECTAVATAAGHTPRPPADARARSQLSDPKGQWMASMLRDLQRGGAVEADHVVGDMLARAKAFGTPHTLLAVAYTHLKVYEAARAAG
ncbi:MAG: 2-dehydropantoate 2-reductase [Acetobacteraceae bacterium]|nr:2-dehydropantoate 2-reductase [Acetobacteraceae bacterium]